MMSKTGHLYYKTDKNVFDALHNRKIGKTVIIEQLKDRGILISDEDEKDNIMEYASPLFTNYYDQVFLLDTLSSSSSKKTYSNVELSTKMKSLDMQKIMEGVKSDRENNETESVNLTKNNDGSFVITSTYTEADLSKNVMSQSLTKTTEVRVWEDESGRVQVRGVSDKKGLQIISAIENEIKVKDQNMEKYVIEFSTIVDHMFRNEFFRKLINSIDGFDAFDVKSVSTSTGNSPETEDDGTMLPYVNKLILNGSSVINSKQFTDLYNSGFYISKIEWTAIEKAHNGDKIDFTAEFKDSINCTGFTYTPLRLYKSKDNGDFNVSSSKLSNIAETALLSLIEQSARSAHKEVIEMYNDSKIKESGNEKL